MAGQEMPGFGKTRAGCRIVERDLGPGERRRTEAIGPGDVEEGADQLAGPQSLVAARRQLDVALAAHRDGIAIAEAAQRKPGPDRLGGLVDQVDAEAVQTLVG